MLRSAIARVVSSVVVLICVSIVTFGVLEAIPGDAAVAILGTEATAERVEVLSGALGLDRPLPERYLAWAGGLLHGDAGTSRLYGMDVAQVIRSALPCTVELAVYAMVIALVVSLALGLASALMPGTWVDAVARVFVQLASALPAFWVAILLMLGFAAGLGWFPVSGYVPLDQGVFASLRSLTLPALAIAAAECGVLIRTIRTSVLAALDQEFMEGARAKGLTRRRTVVGYALRSALVAPLTVASLQFAKLLGGTAVVENVFALPGLGRLLLTAVSQRDAMLVMGIVMLVTFVVVVVMLLGDLLTMAVNPQMRATEGGEA